jgi:hypothetical protein
VVLYVINTVTNLLSYSQNIVQTRGVNTDTATNIKERLAQNVDHINEFGFKNDGYDYFQHLREMGGGKFIGKDGKVGEVPRYVLPDDVLPSTGMDLKRDYEAITISDRKLFIFLHFTLSFNYLKLLVIIF